ncbi:MAG: serine/threonine-protein kinase [Alphaproteobacteria bacterium]
MTEDPRAALEACLADLAENQPADAVLARLRALEPALRGDAFSRARFLRARAVATNRLGFAGEALGDLHEARRLLEGGAQPAELAEVFRAIATVFSWRGESREAALALLRVIAEAGDDRLTVALALIEGGRLQMEIGRPADARALFARALVLGAALPKREVQRAWINLLQSSVAAGHIEAARVQLGAAGETLEGAPARLFLLRELETARCALAARDFTAAAAALDRAALRAPKSLDAFERVEIAEVQAEFALARGDAENAASLLTPVIARYADDDLAAREVRTRLVQARALEALGRADEAERTLGAALRRALTRSLTGYADEVRSRLMSDYGGPNRIAETPMLAEVDPAQRFVRQRALGSGAFGKVFRAYDLELGIEVAIKRAARGESYDPALRDQLLQAARTEAIAAARLDHPGIARVFGLLTVQGGDTLVIEEFVEGPTLRQAMEAGLARTRSLALLSRIAFALAAVHGAGLVHRDLKPDNVILRGNDAPVIIDFGVALLAGSRHQAGTGTPAYMAPEQAHGESVDARADLFALGVMAHEMLTGARPDAPRSTLPFTGFAQMRAIRGSLTAAGIAPDIAELVSRLLAPRPRLRPASAADVGAAFARAS